MKRNLTAWIKAERKVRALREEITQLPVPDPASADGPLCKDVLGSQCAEAEVKAAACEKKVRDTERDMKSGAWRPVDINEAIISSKSTPKGSFPTSSTKKTPELDLDH
jgi:hypothetical protein